jgi:hypothetical protein
VYAFRGSGAILSNWPPQMSILVGGMGGQANDYGQIVNHTVVIGQAKPKKPPPGGGDPPKPPIIRGEASAPKGNRFWENSMGNGHHDGVGGWRLEDIYTNGHIHTNATAGRIARMRLRRFTQAGEQVTFGSAIIPHIDPYDSFRVHTEDGAANGTYEMMQATFPLRFSADTPMTVGFTRRMRVPAQVNRR